MFIEGGVSGVRPTRYIHAKMRSRTNERMQSTKPGAWTWGVMLTDLHGLAGEEGSARAYLKNGCKGSACVGLTRLSLGWSGRVDMGKLTRKPFEAGIKLGDELHDSRGLVLPE